MIIGIGVDIESIERHRKMPERVKQRFIERVLTPNEREYCKRLVDPHPCIMARFCVKEAFVKSLGIKTPWSIPFKNLEVIGRPPRVKVTGKALEILEEK